jgi:hypothetical protein
MKPSKFDIMRKNRETLVRQRNREVIRAHEELARESHRRANEYPKLAAFLRDMNSSRRFDRQGRIVLGSDEWNY